MRKPNYTELIKFRATKDMKKRTERVAHRRGCAPPDVSREALLNFLQAEEARLGLAIIK